MYKAIKLKYNSTERYLYLVYDFLDIFFQTFFSELYLREISTRCYVMFTSPEGIFGLGRKHIMLEKMPLT